jgi:Cys-tRNA(Pro)/Cys-tRNA(Cys) deacylase
VEFSSNLRMRVDEFKTSVPPFYYLIKLDIDNWLLEHGIWHRIIEKQETIHTADASDATGIDLHRITKNLVSITDTGENVIIIIPGDTRVNLKAVARALRVKNVKLMPFDQSELISGYPPGGTPSLGFKSKMRVILDKELEGFETFFCGGGVRERLLEVRFSDVKKINDAIVASITK